VNFDHLKASSQRAFRGLHERVNDSANLRDGKLSGRLVTLIERNRARRINPTPPALLRAQRFAAQPRCSGAGLPSRMRNLNPGNRSLRFHKPRHARQRRNVFVLPNPQIRRADPSIGGHCRRFGKNQCGASHRARAQMHQMPIRGQPVFAGILAHGRNHDAVAKSYFAYRQRRKQMNWSG